MRICASIAVLAAVTVCSPRLLPFCGRTIRSARAENVGAIAGGRPASDPGHFTFQHFDELEAHLREDLTDAADEVFALLSGGYWGDAGQIIVRVRMDKAQLVFMPDRARTFERSLSVDELEAMKAFLTGIKAFNIQALTNDIADGMQYELVHLTRSGGQRLFMSNPDVVRARPYVDICQTFRALLSKPGLTLSYRAHRTSPDLQVLVSDPALAVASVHMDGSKLLLQLERRRARWAKQMDFPSQHRIQATLSIPEGHEPIWVAWPSLAPADRGRLAALSLTRIPIPHHAREWINATGWASEHDGVRYFAAEDGLRRVSLQGPDTLVVSGKMASPLVAADGRTVLVARTDNTTWGHGAYFALVDPQAQQVRRLNIATANEMVPIMPTPTGFLVKRARSSRETLPPDWGFEGPDSPEYFLVATSGAVKKVDGDFAPLPGVLKTPLQPAGGRTVWAVRTDWRNQISTLGRYDLDRFVFIPVRELRGLAFGTNDIWVDEAAGQAYALYDGDLVRFSLNP